MRRAADLDVLPESWRDYFRKRVYERRRETRLNQYSRLLPGLMGFSRHFLTD